MRLHAFPRHPLTFGPSPVHRLARLTAHLGGAEIWAKREDVSSGLAYGGNKVRKLEYIVPDALASGADTLVSIGGVQSNHTRQVAAVAAHLGLKARLVQEKWVPWDDPVNDKVGNILLSRMMGADVRLDPSGFDSAFGGRGRMPCARSRMPGARPTRSRPVRASTRLVGWASRTGPSRSPIRRRLSGSTSTPSSCAPSRGRRTPG
jgi:hypothetical protein